MCCFQSQVVEDRINIASRLKVCTNCLSYNHFSRDCLCRRSCRKCGNVIIHLFIVNSHHLKQRRIIPPANQLLLQQIIMSVLHATYRGRKPRSFWESTVESRGRQQKARALLDSGSHMSFMTSRLAQSLKVKKIRDPTRITGIDVPDCTYKAEFSLLPKGHFPISMKAAIISKITGDLPGSYLMGVQNLPFLHGLSLVDPNFYHPGRIYLLFGTDVMDDIMLPGRRSSKDCKLHARETVFGWSIRGKCYPESPLPDVHPFYITKQH